MMVSFSQYTLCIVRHVGETARQQREQRTVTWHQTNAFSNIGVYDRILPFTLTARCLSLELSFPGRDKADASCRSHKIPFESVGTCALGLLSCTCCSSDAVVQDERGKVERCGHNSLFRYVFAGDPSQTGCKGTHAGLFRLSKRLTERHALVVKASTNIRPLLPIQFLYALIHSVL